MTCTAPATGISEVVFQTYPSLTALDAAPASDLEAAILLPPPGRPGTRHRIPADSEPWVPQI